MNLRVLAWAIALVVGVMLSGCHVPHANLGTLTSMGKVTSSSGGVKILRGGAPVAAARGAELQAGDVVETDAHSTAVIDFIDGSATLMPNTKVTVGSIWTWFGRVFFSGPVDNDTEYANMSVEGTEYLAQVEQNRLIVTVLAGQVRVSSKTGAFGPVAVGARELLEVTSLKSAGAAAPTKRTISQEELNSIVEELNATHDEHSRLVPDVTGLSQEQATQKLSALGFTAKTEKHPARDDQIGKVFSQSPAPGTRGTEVSLAVGARAVHVPDLRGLTLEQVAAQLPAGLRLGRQRFEFTGKQPLDRVVRQDPAPGKAAIEGSRVDIVIEALVMPDLREKSIEQAQIQLRRLGVKVRTREQPDSARAERTVISQSPAGGTRLDPAQAVELVIAVQPAAQPVPGAPVTTAVAPTDPSPTQPSPSDSDSPVPILGPSPQKLEFETVEVGSSAELPLTLHNYGYAPLTVSRVDFGSRTRDFAVAPLPTSCASIDPDSWCSVTVTYRPSTAGTHSATLRVQSNDSAGTTTLEVVGSATAPASPTAPTSPTPGP